MRRSETREVVIGGLAMLGLGIVIALSYGGEVIGDRGEFTGYRLYAMFNRVDGLTDGAPVYLSGIQVGRVESMSLEPNYRARVSLRMEPHVDLPADTAAAIHTEGLFGAKFVTLDPGGGERLLEDGDTITFTQDALIVSQLLDLIIAQGKAARGGGEPEQGSGSGRDQAPAPDAQGGGN